MTVANVSGGGRFEQAGGYVRAKRVGDHVFVSGTLAIEASGRLHAPGDTYAQTRFVLERMDQSLRALGSELAEVVRTRAYLSDISHAGAFVRAHGELLAEAQPVLTAVQAALTTPGAMVEIELEAFAGRPHG
jgi:enamine deaminase RidA (YjgF/YER057c/UK114 family)